MRVTGFGDYLIHFSPMGDERFSQADLMKMRFTGAEANVCAALSYWGENTAFVTKLPEHLLSQRSLAFLKSLSVDTKQVSFGNGRMGIYFLEKGNDIRSSKVIYDRDNTAFITSVYDDFAFDDILQETDILYVTGITPALSESLFETTQKLLRKASEKGISVFYDINFRPTIGSAETWGKILMALSPYITHLIGNEEHLKTILRLESSFGEAEPEKRLSDISEKTRHITHIPHIAVTVRRTLTASHTQVYAAYFKNGVFAQSPMYNLHVVDRVGSGDAFSAGLIYGELHGLSAKESICFAMASGALKHTVEDDINFVTVDEIKDVMVQRGYDVKR